MRCTCGKPFVRTDMGESVTCVGYCSPPDHNHDDNCRVRVYRCADNHSTLLSIVNKCPSCTWTGKKACFCSVKIDKWPTLEGERL